MKKGISCKYYIKILQTVTISVSISAMFFFYFRATFRTKHAKPTTIQASFTAATEVVKWETSPWIGRRPIFYLRRSGQRTLSAFVQTDTFMHRNCTHISWDKAGDPRLLVLSPYLYLFSRIFGLNNSTRLTIITTENFSSRRKKMEVNYSSK